MARRYCISAVPTALERIPSRSRSRGIAYPSRSIRYQLRGNRSRIRFACASKQNDAEQERNNEWDGRDSNNETGIGVPWRGESTRIGKVQTPDYKQQQRDQTNDHECARGAATDPPGLPESNSKRSRCNVS